MVGQTVKELEDIAHILRRDVLTMTTKAGSGHPTSCMSCAEIMSVLYFHEMRYDKTNPYEPNNDEFVMSKGHAAPILYASLIRAGALDEDPSSLRKLRSNLQGHPMPQSVPWVKVGTGSLGQGLSVACGMALAGKLRKQPFRTYVLLGDSEMSEGSNYEALQFASHYRLDNLVAIVDVNRLGQRGETMLGHDVKTYAERFKSFGWYPLIVDGHHVKRLLKALSKARRVRGKPVVLLAQTFKGKGVPFLENKEGWHGKALSETELIKALNAIPRPAMPLVKIQRPESFRHGAHRHKKPQYTVYAKDEEVASRKAYGQALAHLAKENDNVLALDAEVSNSTYSNQVKSHTPKQFIENFIMEQNMVGVAQGLSAKGGYHIYASSFSAFLSRAHDQLRMGALSGVDLIVSGSHAGVSIGEDGASQMGLEDIALFRSLANSQVFSPADAYATQSIVHQAKSLKGTTYIRTARPNTPLIYSQVDSFTVGDFKIHGETKRDAVVLVGTGITVHEALGARAILKELGVHACVVDAYCLKPFNAKKFAKLVSEHGNKVVVVEDHRPEGGLGEVLSSALLSQGSSAVVSHLAIDAIPHSGTGKQLMKKYGIDAPAIAKAAQALVKKKNVSTKKTSRKKKR